MRVDYRIHVDVALGTQNDSHNIMDRGCTVVKVLCYKSEGRWFDPTWCQWIFH